MRALNRSVAIVASLAAVGVGAWVGFGSGEEPHPHEYASLAAIDLSEALDDGEILRRTTELRDFTGPSLDGETVDARTLVREHPVVLFTYIAEWCENCRYEAPHLARLYWKYADRGFRIVARAEYSHPDVVREMAGDFGTPYPIIQGSANPDPEDEDAVRTTTHHFKLRKALEDPRKWGTPMNLLVVDGDVNRMHLVMGEFFPEELDRFLDENLPPQTAHDPAPGNDQAAENEQVILEFFEAWERLDPAELAGFFTEDGIYHNIPAQPVQGRENVENLIRGFIADWTNTEWEVRTLVAEGDVVVAERIDHVTAGESSVDLPVVGVFEMEDGRIAAWRDYFDLATYQRGLQ